MKSWKQVGQVLGQWRRKRAATSFTAWAACWTGIVLLGFVALSDSTSTKLLHRVLGASPPRLLVSAMQVAAVIVALLLLILAPLAWKEFRWRRALEARRHHLRVWGFLPTSYRLTHFTELPLGVRGPALDVLQEEKSPGGDKRSSVSAEGATIASVGDFFLRLQFRKVHEIRRGRDASCDDCVGGTLDGREIEFRGPRLSLDVLQLVLELANEENWDETIFFWYDTEPLESGEVYWFFAYREGRVVRDAVGLVESYDKSGLRVSSVLVPVQARWADEPSSEEALEYERLAMDDLEAPSIAANLREAYRRFYTGTEVGRLMAMRSDRRMYHVKPEDLGIERIVVLLHRRISFVGMVLGGLLATIAVELFLHH